MSEIITNTAIGLRLGRLVVALAVLAGTAAPANAQGAEFLSFREVGRLSVSLAWFSD